VLRALLLMQQHVDNPISVTELARRMGNSKRQIERHFRTSLGVSPQSAFLQIRLSLAKHLIETTDKSIASIAVECGFCDSSHLSRMFRQRYENAPLELRSAKSQPVLEGAAA
jgi:transcriptional regulator GlxA family with amidase domain